MALECEYPPVCADGTELEEGLHNPEERMNSLRPHASNPDAVAGARDVTHVLMSPRVGGCNSSFHPMRNRSLSQKRIEPSSYLLFVNGHCSHEAGDDASRDVNSQDGDSGKVHRKQDYGHVNARFGDSDATALKYCSTAVAHFPSSVKKNWRQSAFYVSILLVMMFFLLKVMFVGWFSVHDQAAGDFQVMLNKVYVVFIER